VSRTQPPSSPRLASWPLIVAQCAALLVGLLLTVPTEIDRFRAAANTKAGLVAWVLEINLDTTLPFCLLVVAPILWFIRRRKTAEPVGQSTRRSGFQSVGWAWVLGLCCAATSIAASAWIAGQHVGGEHPVRFGDLPPAYHDEFSYLLQAKTFLGGRLSFPSHPRMPGLFDQMHVLNEGRFASRYFPGVGLWIAPFLALGHPYGAQWLAGGLSAFFVFWAGRELAGNAVGLLAGMLTALSPGMGLFSNLLLSHQATIAALSLFLFCFLRFVRTGIRFDAFCAGCGLSFAMLCRPMTAAGFGLPFGLWFAWWLVRGKSPNTAFAARFAAAAVLAAPLLFGGIGLFFYDRAVTGNGFVSPYQLYTDVYTPRHVYGFNNVTRGEQHLGPKVLDHYDRWAENLTPRLAAQNVAKRAAASAQWTLGMVPLAMAGVVFLLAVLWRVDWRWRLVAAAVLTLHTVHVPYWFAGIMNWHYVFESGPLLLLIFAVTTTELIAFWRERGQIVMPAWWGALVAAAVFVNWSPLDPFWSYSRVDQGVEEVAFARLRYNAFQHMLGAAITRRPALVLIEGDPADRSMDYVVNDPDLSAPVLRGRYKPGKTDVDQVRAAFPDRAVYLFRVKTSELQQLTP
jgi:4-amino-4-deoxy-L-arabinose transferase-like glycosyltransferase